MDQIKIGKFIAQCRKNKNLTQLQLAQQLNITDRAVSKWETGKAMPDSMIMLDLCKILGITINDLLSGEIVSKSSYDKQLESNTINLVRQKQYADKNLLAAEIVIGVMAVLFMLTLDVVASYVPMADWLRIVLVVVGAIIVFAGAMFALRIEQIAGYYECAKCKHRYVPTYKQVNLAMHLGRTRYLKCPHCNKRSWHKKVLTKD